VKECNGQPGTPSCPVCGHDGPCAGCYERDQKIHEARRHLDVAILQSIDSDDKIIMDHVRDAARILGWKP